MVSRWNTSGYAVPTSTTSYSDHITDLDDGVETALTCDSGTTSPNTGAPTAWGAAEVGRLWADTGNEFGAGDSLGITLKRWEKTAGSTYSMRNLQLKAVVTRSPNFSLLSVTATSVTAWTDMDVGGATGSDRALFAHIYAEAKESTPGAGVFAAFRKKGVTTDAHVVKLYPQVSGLTVSGRFRVGLDTTQVFQYQLVASGNTSANLTLALEGYEERV